MSLINYLKLFIYRQLPEITITDNTDQRKEDEEHRLSLTPTPPPPVIIIIKSPSKNSLPGEFKDDKEEDEELESDQVSVVSN